MVVGFWGGYTGIVPTVMTSMKILTHLPFKVHFFIWWFEPLIVYNPTIYYSICLMVGTHIYLYNGLIWKSAGYGSALSLCVFSKIKYYMYEIIYKETAKLTSH
jgi:hypothetical protein